MAASGLLELLQGVGTACSTDRKAAFGAALPASAETKVGSALGSGLSSFCATASPNDCKVGGTVNTAVGGHRQQPAALLTLTTLR
jgi:hypothetical protein